ncbi:MAG: hypothetical protein ACD_57C00185G0002 [uncultured bacterium]|nr:MAG: hypothetical protein ACD_57C00185G0002 [uncultured bacterium]
MNRNLAIELENMNFLDPNPKIDLWLAYKEVKPVSSVYEMSNSEEFKKALIDWCEEAKMYIEKHPGSPNFLVGKEEKNVKELSSILFSEKEEDIIRKCELYGYPPETALATVRNFHPEKINYPEGFSIKSDIFEGKMPWWEYVRYVVRKGHELEDSLVAKKWYETIKTDLPKTHLQFVKSMHELQQPA